MMYLRSLFFVTGISVVLGASEPIRPLPETVDYDEKKAALGRALFSDTILSKDRKISCASCHSFEHGGADPRPVSVGVGGRKGNVQSPTVYNARYNFRQFWNGRVESLEEQASGPIHNPVEMGMDSRIVEERLNADPYYRNAFKAVFGTPEISYPQVIDAIVEFEKALVTPNSRFDRFLRGETQLSPLEAKGYRRFKELGCITCHNGVNIGGNSFQKMGIFIPYKYNAAAPDRYSVTKNERHKNVFKVPTLRNIALTAPYFHDASAKTLEAAVRTMSFHNLGTELSEEDIRAITAFLKTLTGERPKVLR